jgi:hypothetical protein
MDLFLALIVDAIENKGKQARFQADATPRMILALPLLELNQHVSNVKAIAPSVERGFSYN